MRTDRMRMMNKISGASLSDLKNNPEKYGLPTFEQFVKNRNRYQTGLSEQETLANIDNGSQNLRGIVRRYIFEVEGYQFKTLEAAERACKDMGIPVDTFVAEVLPTVGGGGEIKVKFMSREEKQKRDQGNDSKSNFKEIGR